MKNEMTGAIPLFMEPWLQNTNPIWLGTEITLARNLEKFLFPQHLKAEPQKQIFTLLSNLLTHQKEFKGGVVKKGEECQPVDREYLIEHFFLPQQQIQGSPGTGFFLDATGSLLASINLDNHLVLHKIDKTGQIEKQYKSMLPCEEAVERNLGFAFSNRFGYLTSQPEMAGCGMKVRAFLQLSALIHTNELQKVLEQEAKEGIEALPLFRDHAEWTLDIVVLENRYCLGITEEALLSSVRMFAEKLLELEQKKRLEIQAKPTNELKDKVSRALAVLQHSYQIDAKEAMNALSLIKLGATLGWIMGADVALLNELFFVLRRAHFIKLAGENISPEALLHRRAEFIQKKLGNLSCNF